MVKAIQALLSPHLKDINPFTAGWSIPTPGHYLPATPRTYHLIHYIREGRGTVTVEDKTYPVHAGQAFIILPGQMVSYTADLDDPWVYHWLSFTGELAASFSSLPTVFQVPEDAFPNLKTLHEKLSMKGEFGDDLAYLMASDLLLFYARVLKDKDRQDNYIQQICDHVQLCYMQKLSVEEFAQQFGMDRHYMTRQFKKKIGYTIQDYILYVRMTQSKRYLQLGYSVKETSQLCGYSSPAIFSKLFIRTYNESPSHYRKRKENKRNSKTEG